MSSARIRVGRSSIAAVAALAVGLLVSAPASASSTPTLSETDTATLEAFLDSHGVADSTQDALLAKLEAGTLWDSVTGGKVVAKKTTTTATATDTILTYADGSIAVNSVQTNGFSATGTISPMSVSGCTTVTSGLTRKKTGCLVSASTGLITIGFHADYTYKYASTSDLTVTSASIQRAYSPMATIIGGNYSDLGVTTVRATAASGAPAISRASAQFNVGTVSTMTGWVQLNIPIWSYSLAYSSSN